MNKETVNLGVFDSEVEAARVYDAAAKKGKVEGAQLNFDKGASSSGSKSTTPPSASSAKSPKRPSHAASRAIRAVQKWGESEPSEDE